MEPIHVHLLPRTGGSIPETFPHDATAHDVHLAVARRFGEPQRIISAGKPLPDSDKPLLVVLKEQGGGNRFQIVGSVKDRKKEEALWRDEHMRKKRLQRDSELARQFSELSLDHDRPLKQTAAAALRRDERMHETQLQDDLALLRQFSDVSLGHDRPFKQTKQSAAAAAAAVDSVGLERRSDAALSERITLEQRLAAATSNRIALEQRLAAAAAARIALEIEFNDGRPSLNDSVSADASTHDVHVAIANRISQEPQQLTFAYYIIPNNDKPFKTFVKHHNSGRMPGGFVKVLVELEQPTIPSVLIRLILKVMYMYPTKTVIATVSRNALLHDVYMAVENALGENGRIAYKGKWLADDNTPLVDIMAARGDRDNAELFIWKHPPMPKVAEAAFKKPEDLLGGRRPGPKPRKSKAKSKSKSKNKSKTKPKRKKLF